MDSPLAQPTSATRDWVGYSNGFFIYPRDGIFGFFWILFGHLLHDQADTALIVSNRKA
jgi:hypothetical protein